MPINSVEFPDDKPIRAILIGHCSWYVYSLRFFDADKKAIVDIKGAKNKCEWKVFEVEEGADIIGLQSTEHEY